MCIKTRIFPLAVIALLITSAVLLGGDSWRKKTPDQWDEDEINQILTDSPWARQAKVSFSGRAEGRRGGGQAPGEAGPFPGGGMPGSTPPISGPGGGPTMRRPGGRPPIGDEAWFRPVVRWQSAEAVRSAYAKAGVEALGAEFIREYYVIALTGLPNQDERMARRRAPSGEEMQARFQESTRLYIGSDRCLSPERVQVADQDGELMVLFLFARTDVRPNDKLKFTSQFGPLQLAADFKTKEMQFAGSLDL